MKKKHNWTIGKTINLCFRLSIKYTFKTVYHMDYFETRESLTKSIYTSKYTNFKPSHFGYARFQQNYGK